MKDKPIAKTDYIYCLNNDCRERNLCSRYYNNYIFENNKLYSFCKWVTKNCIESEEYNDTTRTTKTNNN